MSYVCDDKELNVMSLLNFTEVLQNYSIVLSWWASLLAMAENSGTRSNGNGRISYRSEATVTMALNENKLRKAGVCAYFVEVTRITKNGSKIIYKKKVNLQSGASSGKHQKPSV